MADVRRRRIERGLPLTSEQVWRGKASRSERRLQLGRRLMRLRDELWRRRADEGPAAG